MTTLTNMLHGALGALALLIIIPVARQLGRLGLRTRLRGLVRRTLGVQDFEELMLAELRSYRRDVDRLSRDLNSDIRKTRTEVRRRGEALSTHGVRLNRLRREIEEMGLMLRAYTETLGPIWKTAQGHRLPMRLLSTPHLKNILDGSFGGYEAREFAQTELERRRIDADWRERAMNGGKAPTKMDYALGRAPVDPRLPITYTQEIANRVTRTLPLWARELISDLLMENPRRLKPSERARVKSALPVWAQQLIADLRRPR